jgi:hypothetical protein
MNNFKNAFIQYGLDHGHIKPIKETIKKYKIIKFRKSGTQKVMETNLSLDEAKRYCSRPDTKGKNWFCGFTQQN